MQVDKDPTVLIYQRFSRVFVTLIATATILILSEIVTAILIPDNRGIYLRLNEVAATFRIVVGVAGGVAIGELIWGLCDERERLREQSIQEQNTSNHGDADCNHHEKR